jgi:O-antigen/teichoic acid export membrane protein
MTTAAYPDPSVEDTAAVAGARPAGAASDIGARAAANTLLLLAARIASRLIALAVVLVIQHRLVDADFGVFNTVVTYTALVSTVVDLGFNTLYVREGARRLDQLERYLDNVASVKIPLSLVGLLVLSGLLHWRGFDDLVLPAFALMLGAAYSNLLRNTFYANGRLIWEAIDIVMESGVLLLLAVIGLRTGQGVSFFLWAYAVTYAVSCVWFVSVLYVTRVARLRWRLELDAVIRPWFVTGLPLAVTAVLANVYWKVDVPILQASKGNAEVGWYTLAYSPFQALLFIPFTLRNVAFPVLGVYFRSAPDMLRRGAAMLFRALLILGWPCTVGLLVLTPQITQLLHFRYPQAEASLRILAIAIVFMFVDNTFITAINAMDRQKTYMFIALVGLAVNLGLDLSLIPRWGYLGASWATVITEVVLVSVGWSVLARTGVRLDVPRLSWRVLLAGAGMGAVLLLFHNASGWTTVAAILTGTVAYVLALVAVRAITDEELALVRRSLPGRRALPGG